MASQDSQNEEENARFEDFIQDPGSESPLSLQNKRFQHNFNNITPNNSRTLNSWFREEVFQFEFLEDEEEDNVEKEDEENIVVVVEVSKENERKKKLNENEWNCERWSKVFDRENSWPTTSIIIIISSASSFILIFLFFSLTLFLCYLSSYVSLILFVLYTFSLLVLCIHISSFLPYSIFWF